MSSILGLEPLPDRQSWEKSLGEFLEIVVGSNPDKIFVEIAGQRITYSDFYRRCRSAATMFRDLGIGHGDRVCLFLPNVPEVLYTWFGLALIGGIAVTINTAYRRDEMAFILNNAEASTLVAHESLLDVATQAADIAPCVRHRLFVGSDAAPSGWGGYSDLLAASPEIAELPPVAPTDISMLQYTSGTTGNPKGVQVTHQMYVSAGQGFALWTQATPDDRFFTCLPYFHANAQYYSTMGTLAAGATLVVQDRFSASRFWDQVREARATVVNFIGMMMPVLSKNDPQPDDRNNTVRLFYGSPAFSPEFLAEFEQRFGTDIIVGFGMTETCYGTIETIRGERRPNSSGQPRQHPDSGFENAVRIVDDAGDPVPNGQPGEITIRNPATMAGYWRNDAETSASLRDGWLFTGDLGWLDDDNYLYFVDRKKDVIRRRGENISSQEVEDVIKSHESVLDCAIIAVPSELGEDEVKAYITPRPGRVSSTRGRDLLVRRPPRLLQGSSLHRNPRRTPSNPEPAGPKGRPASGARRPDLGLLRPRSRRHPNPEIAGASPRRSADQA